MTFLSFSYTAVIVCDNRLFGVRLESGSIRIDQQSETWGTEFLRLAPSHPDTC